MNDPMAMGDDMGAGAPPPSPGAGPPEAESKGPTTLFLSKETLGGKTVKEGDTLSLTIKSVDPETGGAEATVEIGGGEMGDANPEGGYEAAFDKAMPPETEGAM